MTVNTNNEMDILGWDDEVEEGSASLYFQKAIIRLLSRNLNVAYTKNQ